MEVRVLYPCITAWFVIKEQKQGTSQSVLFCNMLVRKRKEESNKHVACELII